MRVLILKFSCMLLLSLFSLFSLLQTTFAAKKSYIVYLGSHSHGKNPTFDDIDRARNYHNEFLGSILGSVEEAKHTISSSYGRYINGFAAVLEEEHAKQLEKHPEVVSIFENGRMELLTTRSWEFLGMEKDNIIPPNSLWNKARFGEDVIIGNIDTGVWPESKSFSDEGMGPVPPKWRGICQNDTHFGVKCNRKLIGIRYFNQGLLSLARKQDSNFTLTPDLSTGRDSHGHGTHTLSTAGGSVVKNVSVFGNVGDGTAKGGAPKARVASYRVCWWPDGQELCHDEDMLHAFDAAIYDGVDVLSVSLAKNNTREFFEQAVAIGSFHAMMHGIAVVAACGNEGPKPRTLSNEVPWLFTVGASTTDREFTNSVTLGNKKVLKGLSIALKHMPSQNFYPLITGEHAKAANATTKQGILCTPGALDPKKIKGKILVCYDDEDNDGDEKSLPVDQAGAIGMILVNAKEAINQSIAATTLFPTSILDYPDGLSIKAYINSTDNPVASMTDFVTEYNTKPSPQIPYFSSRGPNTIDQNILKPDVVAPGVNIIAAFSEGKELDPREKRPVPFIPLFGTSMSCPHVAGIVGLLKALHPDWSPAMIRSAIMTTAKDRDSRKRPILDYNGMQATPFAYGAGQVSPNDAMDPGLVYELGFDDYLGYICNRGYDQSKIAKFTEGKQYVCPKSFNIADLNYPSITLPNLNRKITITRRVRNVGAAGTYMSRLRKVHGVSIVVEPSSLNFTKYGEEKIFKVTFTPKEDVKHKNYVFGNLIWSDGFHRVRSPITVKLT